MGFPSPFHCSVLVADHADLSQRLARRVRRVDIWRPAPSEEPLRRPAEQHAHRRRGANPSYITASNCTVSPVRPAPFLMARSRVPLGIHLARLFHHQPQARVGDRIGTVARSNHDVFGELAELRILSLAARGDGAERLGRGV